MKKTCLLLTLTAALLASGCASTYSKSIAVTKDANGKVVQTVETETISQPGRPAMPVKLDHLKGVQPNWGK